MLIVNSDQVLVSIDIYPMNEIYYKKSHILGGSAHPAVYYIKNTPVVSTYYFHQNTSQ